MSASVGQYLELYEAAREQLGARPAELEALRTAGELDDAFAPTDYGVNFAASPRLQQELPAGVELLSLRRVAAEHPDWLSQLPDGGIDDAETRLNDLLWADGIMLRVAPGVVYDKPLQLVNNFLSTVDLMAVRRVVISLGRGAQARLLVCDRTRDAERRYLSAELIKVVLDEGAALDLDFLEESSARTTRRSTLNASLAANSSLRCTSATLSCGDTRMRIRVDINGAGANAEVNGMVIADGEQCATYATNILHHAENTTSNQLFKYVADGNSRCSFEGRIVVDEQARFTQAYQTNRNMLASAGARMHAEPTLEIYCDEVKCSHGAATGQLDDKALFYMRQRGIDEATARRMLMQAFVGEVIDSVHIPALRERLHLLVERRFSGLGMKCADCSLNQTDGCKI